MCGVLYISGSAAGEDLPYLLSENSKRGGTQMGMYDLKSKSLYKSNSCEITIKDTVQGGVLHFDNIQYSSCKSDSIPFNLRCSPGEKLIHFRASTLGEGALQEVQPLQYRGWVIAANGVLSPTTIRNLKGYLKEDSTENDMYYLLKLFVECGINEKTLYNNIFHRLQFEIEGMFGCVIISPTGYIFTLRNSYPLYYSDLVISSCQDSGETLRYVEDKSIYNYTAHRYIATELKLKSSLYETLF